MSRHRQSQTSELAPIPGFLICTVAIRQHQCCAASMNPHVQQLVCSLESLATDRSRAAALAAVALMVSREDLSRLLWGDILDTGAGSMVQLQTCRTVPIPRTLRGMLASRDDPDVRVFTDVDLQSADEQLGRHIELNHVSPLTHLARQAPGIVMSLGGSSETLATLVGISPRSLRDDRLPSLFDWLARRCTAGFF
jgi:hypothetical protein